MLNALKGRKESPLQALVQRNRAAGRLAPAEPKVSTRIGHGKTHNTGMRLTKEEWAQAVELARAEDRSITSFLRRTYLRGLQEHMAAQGEA